MPSIPLTTTQRIVVLIVGLAILAAVVLALRVDLSSMQNQLRGTGPVSSLLFILLATSLMSVCVPKTAVSLTAGAMFGVTQGLALLVVVATLAAALNYAIGYAWIGPQRLPKNGNDRESASLFAAIISVAADAGWCLHALIRLSPVPTMLISYSMGAIGARFAPFIGAAALATLPQILWVHSGTHAAEITTLNSGWSQWFGLSVSLGVAVVVTFIISREAKRQLRTSISLQKATNP